MSVVSVNIQEHVGISASESPVEITAPGKSPSELDGYRASTPKSDAVENVAARSRKTPETESGCVRD